MLKALTAWLDREVNCGLPGTALGTAFIYALKTWDALCRCTDEGFLEMDNNTAERCMRPSSWAGRTSCLSVLSGLAMPPQSGIPSP